MKEEGRRRRNSSEWSLSAGKFTAFFLGWESRMLYPTLAVFLKARPGLAPLEVNGENPIDISGTWVWAITTGKTHSLNGEMSAAIHSSILVKNKDKEHISKFNIPSTVNRCLFPPSQIQHCSD